jgi:hypothetical protein
MRVIYSGRNDRHVPRVVNAERSSTARYDHGDARNGDDRREITPEEQR